VPTNADSQQQFNEALQQGQRLLTAQTKALSSQAEALAGMVASIRNMDAGRFKNQIQDLQKDMFGLDEALKKIDDHKGVEHLGKSFSQASKTGGRLNDVVSKLESWQVKLASTGAGAFSGFTEGLKFSINLAKSLGSASMTLIKVIGHLGASIITAPFKMLKGLISMADQGGSNELAQALEKIREEFGYLRKTAGGAIIELSRSMKGELANTGLSTYRVFGNLAKRLEYFQKYAHALGPIFDSIWTKVGEGGAEALGAFNKAMGIADEGLKALAQRAITSGKTVNETNRELANYALQLSDAFGVTMKQVTKDVGVMMADFQHFGHLGTKSLTQVAVYARKLGVEIKALGGLMDKWMNFEDAAQGAAQLSQAFGLNIDALNMMKAQDPGEKMEQLRKAFFRAGKSVETMTYQERRLLSQQTGLDDAAISLAFSLKNQGLSYDQVTRKGAAAQRHQLTQAQALEKLSGAIERLVQSGSGDGLGFVDKFFKGFTIGIRRTKEFREIMYSLRRTLRMTLRAGIETGRAFVHAFPGIKDFFKGLAGFFEPARFRVMLGKVKDAFRNFFNALAGKDPQALPQFLKQLKSGFLDYFDSRSEAGQKFLNGAKRIFEAFAAITNGLLRKAIEGVITGVTFIADVIAGRKKFQDLVRHLGATGGFLGGLFDKLFEGIPDLAGKLFTAIKNLGVQTWTRFGPRIENAISGYLSGTLAVSLGSAFARAFVGAAGSALLGGAIGLFKRFAGVAQEPARRAADQISRRLNQAQGVAAGAQRAGEIGSTVSDGLKGAGRAAESAREANLRPSDVGKLLIAAGVIAVGMIAALYAMKSIVMWVKQNHVEISDIIKAGIVMTAAGGTILLAAGSVAALGAASKLMTGVNPGTLALSLGMLGTVLLAMVGTSWLMIKAVQNFPIQSIAKAVLVMGAMAGMMTAAIAMTVASGVVGALIVATEGLAVVAIAAGMATMAVVLGVMVSQTMSIMRTIDRFHPQDGFERKAQVFVSLVQAVGSFAGTMMETMKAASPGITGMISSVLFGQNPQEQMRKTLGKIKEVIDAVGVNIISVMDSLMRHSTQMKPEQLRNGEIIAQMLAGVGEFARSLQPSAELLKDTSAWFEGSDVTIKLQLVGEHITRLSTVLTGTMTTVLDQLSVVSRMNWTEQGARGVQAYSSLLKGVADLAQALLPNAGFISRLNQSADFAGALGHISSFMQTMMKGLIDSHLFETLSGVVSSVVSQIRGLNPTQSSLLERITPVIQTAVGSLSSTASLFSSLSTTLRSNGNTRIDTGIITQITQLVSTVFTSLMNFVPDTLAKIKALPLSTGEAKGIVAKTQAIRAVMDSVGAIPTAFDSLTRGTNANNNLISQTENKLRIVSAFMNAAFNPSEGVGREFNTALGLLSGWHPPEGLGNVSTRLQTVITGLRGATDFARSVGEMSQQAQTIAEQVKGNTISRIATSVSSMVQEVNNVSNSLGAVNVPNINIALKRLAHDIGLGENGQFVVHRGNFNVNIKVQVTVDSRDMQTTLVQTSKKTTQGPRLATSTA